MVFVLLPAYNEEEKLPVRLTDIRRPINRGIDACSLTCTNSWLPMPMTMTCWFAKALLFGITDRLGRCRSR